MSEKRCKKCGTPNEPRAWFRPSFDGKSNVIKVDGIGEHDTACQEDVCPDGEHLHLLCYCGFSGIAPCADAEAPRR
jgi:hypothetical protein